MQMNRKISVENIGEAAFLPNPLFYAVGCAMFFRCYEKLLPGLYLFLCAEQIVFFMSKKVTITTDFKSFQNMKVIIKRENWFIPEGGIKPIIECPKCGCGILGDSAPHGIKADGTVYASVVCQNEKCDFHSHIQLEDWTGIEILHS